MGMDASKLTAGASVNTACEGPGGAGTGSVTRVVAGTGISVSPPAGTGVVTVTNTAPAPAFGGAPPAVAAASSAGAAATTSRSDHTHQGVASVVSGDERIGATTAAAIATIVQSICATWSINNVRWYALDGVNGNDANAGFSDVSPPAAGAVAVRTAAKLNAILPVNGAGRQVVILIAAGTYPENTDFLTGRYGYRALLARGTVTNATAGSVAFADSTQDRIMCGAVTATGMNAAGYNPTGAATTSSIPCTLAGGGAPGFAAEPALPAGCRLRFDSATTTVALRNAVTSIIQVSGGNTLGLQSTLPAVPAAGDVFYIEMPGSTFNSLRVEGCAHDPSTPNFSVAGLQNVGTVSGARNWTGNGFVSFAFCWATNPQVSNFRGVETSLITQYVLPNGAGAASLIETGGMCRLKGTLSMANVLSVDVPFGRGPFTESGFAIGRCGGVETSAFCVGGGVEINDTGNTAGEYTDVNSIGSNAASTAAGIARSRIIGAGTQPAGLTINSGTNVLNGLDITGSGAKPAIKLNSVGHALYFQTIIGGSTGNTDVGLDLALAKGCEIVLLVLPTVTGTNGDVRLSDGSIISWTEAAGGVIDRSGNRIYAPGNNPLQQAQLSYAGLFINDPVFTGGGTQAELPAGFSTAMNAISWRYNIGRPVTSIKFCWNVLLNSLSGAGASFTINVLKNGVAVGTTGAIPSGSTPTQVVMILAATLGASSKDTDVYSLQLQFTNVTVNVANTLELTSSIMFNGCY